MNIIPTPRSATTRHYPGQLSTNCRHSSSASARAARMIEGRPRASNGEAGRALAILCNRTGAVTQVARSTPREQLDAAAPRPDGSPSLICMTRAPAAAEPRFGCAQMPERGRSPREGGKSAALQRQNSALPAMTTGRASRRRDRAARMGGSLQRQCENEGEGCSVMQFSRINFFFDLTDISAGFTTSYDSEGIICDSMITESAMFDVAARRILKLAALATFSTKTAFVVAMKRWSE